MILIKNDNQKDYCIKLQDYTVIDNQEISSFGEKGHHATPADFSMFC